MKTKRIVVLGAGGQARELAWYLDELNGAGASYELLGFVVSDPGRLGPNDSADRVLGGYEWVETHRREIDAFAIGIGTPAVRLKVAAEMQAQYPDKEWPSIVHPSACIDRATLMIGAGVLVAPNVVVTVNVRLSDFSMLNFGCTVGHEARVGRGTVVNPGANISGGVDLGEGVLVGSGAVVLQYRTVGSRTTVGAGSVVTKNVPAGVTVVGVPARLMDRQGN